MTQKSGNTILIFYELSLAGRPGFPGLEISNMGWVSGLSYRFIATTLRFRPMA